MFPATRRGICRGTQQGKENSRMYNEMVVIKLVQTNSKLMRNIPEVFREEISNHFKLNGLKMYEQFAENEKNEQDSNENAKLTSISFAKFSLNTSQSCLLFNFGWPFTTTANSPTAT